MLQEQDSEINVVYVKQKQKKKTVAICHMNP